jgi:hypothetical protein
MSAGHHAKTITADAVTLPKSAGWTKLPIVGAVLAVVGLAGTFALRGEHAEDGLYAYLIAFLFFLSIAIGGLFYVLIGYLTRAGWGIVHRRLAENMAATMPIFGVLFLPIWLGRHHIWSWFSEEALATDVMLQKKAPFLNDGFFTIRSLLYFGLLSAVALFFYLQSTKQDKLASGSPEWEAVTRRLQMMSAPAIAIAALAATFISFDYMMALDYHWFSTMYGVIFFAGSFMSCFALLAILVVTLSNGDYLGGAITTEHRHAIGKMMWGLMVFWAYTSFSQFMLIWYANIPEETLWYQHRWENGWEYWTVILFFGHFILPFFAMMSRHVKRNAKLLVLGAVWLLAMHYLDLFWNVKPNMHHGHGSPALGPVEILAFVGVGGVFLAAYTFLLQRTPMIPTNDPRLPESLAFEEQ